MARSAPARRQAAALALAGLVAAAVLVLGPGAGAAGGAPAQIDCVVNPNAPECQEQPTTTLTPTTEPEPEDPSPTTTEPSPTTEPATVSPTVATSPPTTARPVPTTAAPVETTTTVPATTPTTQANLLVPGDGTEGAESTTTTLRTETRVQSGSGPSDGTLIALIIGGLVVVAALVGVLTFRYWRATAPVAAAGEPTDRATGGAGAQRGAAVTTSRSSPAGARGAPAP